ncbi:hypothetical protein DYB31_004432 [Aphanomyces astaci]|uniref:Retrovirus-related Pol polyprotein from transposon TNT 1-94-like beta-barrel domain-containing protein n=1 Tax=Aphanomyces astaci TaxID=112090 RepID=A0A397ENX0_APHAT|nr:hypothetical protein DYB31_004432 [Aphanomyces astaci]
MSPTTDISKDNNKAQPLVFRGANFDIFKVRIQAKLRSKGLWKVVNGNEQRDDDEDEDYDSKEDKAFDLLVNSLDDNNLAYVSHVTTSTAAFVLVEQYEARTYADVSHVIHELHTKVYVTGSSMQKHITELRILQQKLLLMGSRIDDDMLGRVLLTSAKEAYPTTVEILRSREPSPTLAQIMDCLLSKESERKRAMPLKRKVDDDQVLYTNKEGVSQPWKKHAKDKCIYCHKISHHAIECRFKKRDLAKGIRRKCLPTPEDHEVNILGDTDQGFILATTQVSIDFSDGWILDSARTADVTGDKTKFKKLSRCGPVTLSLADNSTVTANYSGALAIQVDETYRIERASAKYAPGVTKNLMSFQQLLKDGFELAPWDLSSAMMIKDAIILKFEEHRGVYVLRPHEVQVNACVVRETLPKLVQWHLRLAHLNFGAIKQAARDGAVYGLRSTKSDLAQEYSHSAANESSTQDFNTDIPGFVE